MAAGDVPQRPRPASIVGACAATLVALAGVRSIADLTSTALADGCFGATLRPSRFGATRTAAYCRIRPDGAARSPRPDDCYAYTPVLSADFSFRPTDRGSSRVTGRLVERRWSHARTPTNRLLLPSHVGANSSSLRTTAPTGSLGAHAERRASSAKQVSSDYGERVVAGVEAGRRPR